MDYRVCNLEWITASDNNRAKKTQMDRMSGTKKYDIFKAKKFCMNLNEVDITRLPAEIRRTYKQLHGSAC